MTYLKPSHTSYIRSELFSGSFLKMTIVILIIQLLFVNTSCTTSQKNPLSSVLIEWMVQNLMKPRLDSKLLDDLFNEHKQILIQTLIVRDFRNEKKQSNDASTTQAGQDTTQPNDQEPLIKVLFEKNRTILLQPDYLQMAKDKFAFTIPISLTEEFVKSRNLLHTFVALLYYVKVGTQNIAFYYEMFPLIKVWKPTVSQGLEIPFFADQDLLKERDHQAKLVSNVDIYLFHVNNILPFQSLEGTQEIKFFTRSSDNNQFYFCTPISKQITEQFEENYITLESLHEDLVYRIRFQIKVRPGYYPLIPTIYERGQKLMSNPAQTSESVDSHLNGPNQTVQTSNPSIHTSVESSSPKVPQKTFDKFLQHWQLGQEQVPQHIKLIFSILPKYIKKVLYDGSVPLVLFFGWQIMISFTFSFAIFLCVIFYIILYRNAEKFRGMTYWGLWIGFMALLLIYFANGWYFEEEQNSSGNLFLALYLWWKMRKVAIFEFSFSLPFIKLNKKQWYTPYSSKDAKALKIMVIPTLLFTVTFLAYPFIFQNYRESAKHFQRTFSLQQYIFKRFILVVQKYSLCLYLMIQIILNYMIKSCNGINWKIFILLSNLFLVDNIPVPVAGSIFEVIYYLKQCNFVLTLEILWTILIIQKIHYGNNLQYLPSKNDEDNPGQNKSSSDKKVDQQSLEEKQCLKNDQLNENKEQEDKSIKKQLVEQVEIVGQQAKMVREQTECKQNENQETEQQASALPGLACRHHSDIQASPESQLTKYINKIKNDINYKEKDIIKNEESDETDNIHNCIQQNKNNKSKDA